MRHLAFLLPLLFSAGAGAGEAGGGDFVDPFSDDDDANYVAPLVAGAGAEDTNASGAQPKTTDPDAGLAGPPANFTDPIQDSEDQGNTGSGSSTEEENNDSPFAVDDNTVADIMGLEGGMIKFDGEDEPVAFSSLTADEKRQVISDYKEFRSQQIPQPQEQQVLAQIRQAGGVENFIRERAGSVAPAQALSDDQVMQRYVEQTYPNLTPEQRTKYIDQQKTGDIYTAQVAQIRQHLTAQEQRREEANQLKEDAEYVQAARTKESVADLRITDEVRNRVLGNILEPASDDPSVSKFIRELEDKGNLFEAAFMYYEGRPLLKHYAKGGGPISTIESAPETKGTRTPQNNQRKANFVDPYAEQ